MSAQLKLSKLFAVVFLTVLIWVWADLALDEQLPVSNAVVTVDKSANPRLWVSFDNESAFSLEQVVLKGPVSKVADLQRKHKEGKALEFSFNPSAEKMDQPGNHTLALLPFLQKHRTVKDLGLKVEFCKPDRVSVNVVALVKKPLDVRVFDDEGNLLPASADPKQVAVSVPDDGVERFAEIQLTNSEIEQARVAAITRTPYFRLAQGQTRKADAAVRVTMPATKLLEKGTITGVRLGVLISANLQGRYQVKIGYLRDLLGVIAIEATAPAKRAYENTLYHVILEIRDEDKDVPAGQLSRKLIYNLPSEYAGRGEIKVVDLPLEAHFSLEPVSSAEAPSTGPP